MFGHFTILYMKGLTITNAFLMKLTTIIYLHESENQKAFRAWNSLEYIKNHHICYTLPYIGLLVGSLYKLEPILGEYSLKNHLGA